MAKPPGFQTKHINCIQNTPLAKSVKGKSLTPGHLSGQKPSHFPAQHINCIQKPPGQKSGTGGILGQNRPNFKLSMRTDPKNPSPDRKMKKWQQLLRLEPYVGRLNPTGQYPRAKRNQDKISPPSVPGQAERGLGDRVRPLCP